MYMVWDISQNRLRASIFVLVFKDILKRKCNQYDIEHRRNEIGEYGFVEYDIRKRHNFLYHEKREDAKSDDPWA